MVTRRRGRQGGFTMVEMLIGLVILGIISSLASRAMTSTYQFFKLSMARAEIQRDSRFALDLMNRQLRQARASSVVVTSKDTTQPPYSKIVFDTLTV